MDTRLPEQQPPPTDLVSVLRSAPVTSLLIAINVVVFFVAEAHGSTRDTATLLRFGADWRWAVWQGEWWRMVTSIFLHIGPIHLFWNAYAGFQWSRPIEQRLGAARFIVLYLGSGIAGSAVSVIGHDAVAAGASGALFGILGAYFLDARLRAGSWAAFWADAATQRNLRMTALWFVIGAFAGFDNYAHAGGLVGGLLLAWGFARLPTRAPLALAGAVIVALAFAATRPWPLLHPLEIAGLETYRAQQEKDWDRVVSLTEPFAATAVDPRLLDARATALLELHRPADAIVPLDAWLKLKPMELRARQLRASARAQSHQFDLAEHDMDMALHIAPDDVWTLKLRLSVAFGRWDLETAKRDAEHLSRLAPADVEVHDQVVRVADALRDEKAALAEVERAIQLHPGDVTWLDRKASQLAVFGHSAEAIALLDTLPAASTAGSHLLRCFALVTAGQLARGAAACDEAARLEPGDAQLRAWRGWVRMLRKDTAGAREDFEASKSAMSYAGQALLALRAGDVETATKLSAAADAADANDSEVMLVRAELALKRGDAATARELFADAARHAPPVWALKALASEELRAPRP